MVRGSLQKSEMRTHTRIIGVSQSVRRVQSWSQSVGEVGGEVCGEVCGSSV